MEEPEASRYWCHMCSQIVNPTMEIESIKCPICQSGFVEEMASDSSLDIEFGALDSDRALSSLWAPILLGMMGNQRRREFDDVEDDEGDDSDNHRQQAQDSEDEEVIVDRRRRRSSAAILQLLHSMRLSNQDQDSDRERVILINPFNQSIVVQGSYDNDSISGAPIGSLGDYFVGPELDMLLQHLSENDPNRYGTPPARKEAVEGLPTVRTNETMQCSVCLDDCEVGEEVKEMPCKHKFHTKCILHWLGLHSSCPICRYQLPCDELNGDEGNNERGRRQFSVPLSRPLRSLFSASSTTSSQQNES